MVLNILGIVLSTFGTIISVWSVLTTSTKSVGTAAYLDNQQNDFRKEKKFVWIGTILIVFGAVFQIVAVFI